VEPRNSIDVEFHSSEIAVVVLHGEHDLDSIDQLALALALAGGGRFILVDVLDASFVDSSAINALLRAARLAQRRGGALELVVATAGPVHRALETTGIPLLLTVHESRGPALASLAAAALRAGEDTAPRDLPLGEIEAEAAAARAHLGAQRSGVVIRAQVADAWDTEKPPRRRAA
jgi:stage II sporulation protein AA (anti-sigma F factor antagonist)